MTFLETTRFLIFWCEDDSYVYEVPTLQINPEEMKRLSQEDLSVLVRVTNPGSELETGRATVSSPVGMPMVSYPVGMNSYG